jgi:hypothetical protein
MVSDSTQKKPEPKPDAQDHQPELEHKDADENWLASKNGLLGLVIDEVKEHVDSVVTAVESWVKVDDSTFKNKNGQTVTVVDSKQQEQKSAAVFEYDWNQLSWASLFASEHAGQQIGSESKNDGKTQSAKRQTTELGDGTKITRDGSIEFSSAGAETDDSKRHIVHEWTDEHGEKHRVELKNGCAYHNNTEVSASKITRKTGEQTTTIEKNSSHAISVQDALGIFNQILTADGLLRTLQINGQSWKFEGKDNQWSLKDCSTGEQKAQITDNGLCVGKPDDPLLTLLNPGKKVDLDLLHSLKNQGVLVDKEGHMGTILQDGTIVRLTTIKQGDKEVDIVSLTKGDLEIQISEDGRHIRMRQGKGPWHEVAGDQLPKELRKHIDGDNIHLDGKKSFDFKHRRITCDEPGRGRRVLWESKGGKCSVVHIEDGPVVTVKDNQFEFRDPKHEEKSPVNWDVRTKSLTTPLGTIYSDKTEFRTGNVFYTDGSGSFLNANGTRDIVNRNGDYCAADGTRINADGTVRCGDGKTFSNAYGSSVQEGLVIGSPEHAAAVAGQADTIAAIVAGKALIDFNDIQQLSDQQGNVSGLIAICMGHGDLGSVVRLLSAMSRLSEALAYAVPRAQACEVARQMGIFAPGLIQEMEANIYGKSPLQAVRSDLEFHGLLKKQDA